MILIRFTIQLEFRIIIDVFEMLSEQSKCPLTGVGSPSKYSTGKGTSNRDWWPNSLNLKILSQHSSLVNPMDKKFDYSKEFKKLNFKALKKDLKKLMKFKCKSMI